MFRHLLHPSLLVIALLAFGGAAAADNAAYSILIKDRKFQPSDVQIPANRKIALEVKNLDASPAEFESSDLRREKVVPGGDAVTVYIGPLDPGRYEFFNDFYPTARGHIVAR
jgi:cupredoxin-like protein